MATDSTTKKVCLLGASFDTGNMGVSALTESSIKCILTRWPDAEVSLLASSRRGGEHRLQIMGREITLVKTPIRFCKNVFLPDHFIVLLIYGWLTKLIPSVKIKNALAKRNPYFGRMIRADLVADITGGDSFSDIYGMRRFILVFLSKFLVIQYGRKLVLLPQTYGPFNRRITKLMAGYVIKHAHIVYSRDKEGLDYVREILNDTGLQEKVKFLPDVAFVLEPRPPDRLDVGLLENKKNENTIVVGINISGLLFSGGYTQNNMFGLKTEYRDLINDIIELLMSYDNTVVFLIPHVFTGAGLEIESDPAACANVYETMNKKYPDRIFMARGNYDHNEIKHIIGMCDFFLGSRMHACIAALSQGIPAVGLAYSKKFHGVFDSIGIGELVIDMRKHSSDEVLAGISGVFKNRQEITRHLEGIIPTVQKQILKAFDIVE